MVNIRYSFRLTKAFLSRFKGLIVLGALFGVIIFFAMRFLVPSFLERSILRIGVTGRYRVENLPRFIANDIGSGLTKINEKGEVEPDLADSWETPDSGKTWIFHLKDGVTWHDGGPFLASEINIDLANLTTESPDDNTIVFSLQNPFSPFPSVVSTPIFKKGLLGTGEWKVTKASLANTFFYQMVLSNGKNKKIIKFYPTEERTKLAYKLGEIDSIYELYNANPFDEWKTANVETITNKSHIVTIFFNTKDPILSDKSIRQALVYGLDKHQFTGERAISPISPDSIYYNPQVKKYLFNTKRAKTLINDLPKELRDQLQVKLATTPILLPIAEKIAENWKAVGVDTLVQVTSVTPDDFQAYLAIFEVPEDADQYSIWHSTQASNNISNFENPRIDKLLEDGRTDLDFEDRKKTYLDFQRFLVEELPAVFLYHPETYMVTRK